LTSRVFRRSSTSKTYLEFGKLQYTFNLDLVIRLSYIGAVDFQVVAFAASYLKDSFLLRISKIYLTCWRFFMNILRKLTMAFVGLSVVGFCAMPAHAQAVGDEFASGGTTGNFANDPTGKANTGSQTTQLQQATAPALQGATNGTIGPQGADATYVTGLNTAGTVRVNNLANLEALLNIIANGMEILGIAWGGPTMIMGFMHMAAGTQDAMKRVLFGAAGVTGGLATPGCINWLVASARDANLFN
jgi:hypothetical protein